MDAGFPPFQTKRVRESPLRVQGAFSVQMAALLIILMVTIGLAFRARAYGRSWSPTESESASETGVADTCARTFVLVLLSLVGLLVLGMMYGNVLGAANASR